jgi:hypothetical protein
LSEKKIQLSLDDLKEKFTQYTVTAAIQCTGMHLSPPTNCVVCMCHDISYIPFPEQATGETR